LGASTFGASSFGIAGAGGSDGLGMPILGTPGSGPAGGAAGGAPGVDPPKFAGTEIILVYSLGPCGEGAGAATGGGRNAWVAPPPGPYELAGAGDGPGDGGAPDGVAGPNMRVYSPGSCGCGGWVGAGPVCGNCDGEGKCGPCGAPTGDGLKSCENSLPVGFWGATGCLGGEGV
jgi:hypothetical protein